MAKLYVVGIGPGGKEHMTLKAIEVIQQCPVIVGYRFYITLIEELITDKEVISTGMKGEIERCRAAIEKVREGIDTCIISTGDAGLYGMAGPILEMAEDIEVEVVPGVSSAFCAAAHVGAPIMHDFCSISLSDLLTPWEVIEKRIIHAAEADFVIALYNPKSKGRTMHIEKAFELMRKYKKPDTPVAVVKHAGRSGTQKTITKLSEVDTADIDMMTMVIIGNHETYIASDKMITPRGYEMSRGDGR